jgi:hypothetical protein
MARPKGSKDSRPRASGVLRDIAWAYKNMKKGPGTEGPPPSEGAQAWLEEARENRSKFLATVERVLQAGKARAADKEEQLSTQDQHYGEIIDRLLKEFQDDLGGAMGRGGSARPNGKPEVPALRPGQSAAR